ncbi:unnamed protein product [Caenorhabditis sp. 36 PRJEB53466]|nr:unnamed protein product [Caenorhabditis sp. 36 PRJEB53466]
MTVGYMRDVATANSWIFLKLLLRWKGSIWKAMITELLIWLFFYVYIRNIYEFYLMGTDSAKTFEHIVLSCRKISEKTRTVLTFALGFFVTYISTRWWSIFMTIPWPDTCALQLAAYLRSRGKKFEQDDRAYRQTFMRYLLASYVLVFRDVSERVKKRFATTRVLIPTLLTEEEHKKLKEAIKSMRPWLPIEWALDLLKKARNARLIDEFHYTEVIQTILAYRQQLHEILTYDHITVPLVYVQAVHIFTICYFIISLIGSQPNYEEQTAWKADIDIYLPVYAICEFIVFVGWLKTAFVMLNPFGMDDDDFEINALIDRNLMVSLSYLEDFYDVAPKLIHMKVRLPTNLQTVVREGANPMCGSAVPVKVTKVHQAIIENPQMAGLVNRILPDPDATVTALNTHRMMDEIAEFRTKERLPEQENWPREGRDTGKKLNDLEEVVAKLIDKTLVEEKMAPASLQSTQNMSPEDPTQKTYTGESLKAMSLIQKNGSKMKSRVGSTPDSSTRKLAQKASVSKINMMAPLSPPGVSAEQQKEEASLKPDKTQTDE